MICGTIHLNKRTYLKEEYEDAKKIRKVKKIVRITVAVLYAAVDLLLLEGMPVESLARRGYLADIGELLEGDPGRAK